MNRRLASLAIGLLGTPAIAAALQPFEYPPAPTVDVVDEYHGVKVPDPYRWLEEYSEQTRQWIEAQNRLTFAYLANIPQREGIRQRLRDLWNYERYTVPFREGGRYFFTRNDGLQNQNVLYVLDALDASPRTLLDPNELSADGTVALTGISPSRDGRWVAYGLAEAGSDWNTWRVRDVTSGTDLPDVLEWVKFSSAAWTADGTGFFYSRFDPPAGDRLKAVNEYHRVYFHRLGTPQHEDRLVYERRDQPRWYLSAATTDDGRYLILYVNPGDKIENGIFYKDLSDPAAPVVELLNAFDARYDFVDNDGPIFFIHSDLGAPRGQVWAIDTRAPARENWRLIVPQQAETLQDVSLVGEQFFCTYLRHAASVVRLFALDGTPLGELALPGLGSVAGLRGKRHDTETFYSFGGFATPPTIYHFDIATGQATVFRAPRVAFDPAEYRTDQVFCPSADGTRVPMFITRRRDVVPTGDVPVLLYGYGGFNISITPAFSPTNLAWMEMGGVLAVASLRGGGEYGEEWHRAGMRLNKPNVFDDFIAAAQWLIDHGWTRPAKLAIHGASNGGLLVGACLNRRPDLFGAALPAVGVMDMLRFHRFTIGWGWVGDYGSSDDPEEFRVLYAYSPYHNIREGVCYPPTLITTADHDDRVYPAHSFKYAARLQAAQSRTPGCTNPVLIRIETRAGHGAGKPTSKRIEEAADQLAFLVHVLGVDSGP